MADWACARCRARVAPGAPRCPECPSTEFTRPETEDGMLKINRDGQVSDSANVRAAAPESFGPAFSPDQLLGARHDTPDLTGNLVDSEPAPELAPDPAEVPGDAPVVEEAPEVEAGPAAPAAPSPATPPRTPPRRTAPPAVPRE